MANGIQTTGEAVYQAYLFVAGADRIVQVQMGCLAVSMSQLIGMTYRAKTWFCVCRLNEKYSSVNETVYLSTHNFHTCSDAIDLQYTQSIARVAQKFAQHRSLGFIHVCWSALYAHVTYTCRITG